ncbi:MAG: hypothetical protein AAF585_19565 [Verrucomicrobiota bacterium]
MEQAIESEHLSYGKFGFGCDVEDVLESEDELLLSQKWVKGVEVTKQEIETYFLSNGWDSLSQNRELAVRICPNAWKRGDVIAVDANETNLIKSTIDSKIYPIDLTVWKP